MRSTRTLGGLSVVVLVAVVFMAASSAGQASSKRAGVAAAVVPCSVAALAAAITAANGAGSPTTLELAPDCAYNIVAPATATAGLPVITGDVRLIGGSSLGPAVDVGQPTTTIQRATALSFRLFEVAVGGTLRLQSVRLVNGGIAGLGGAILNAGTLSVVSSVFFANSASNGGGISNSAGANAIVARSRFSSNTTNGVGGGAIINFGLLLATRSEFSSNTALINGGAVNTQPGGNTTLNQSTVANNTSGSLGGGLSNLGSTSLVNTRVEFNTATAGGGGIATGNANVFLTSSVVENNTPDNCSPLNFIPGCVN